MSYEPIYTITPGLLHLVESIAALRERILGAGVELAWVPALQKDARTRTVHASTAIEGNPLTLEEVRALEEGRDVTLPEERARREVLDYFAGLRFIETHAGKKRLREKDILDLHRTLARGVMDQGQPGSYRTIMVKVGGYLPPRPDLVPGLMLRSCSTGGTVLPSRSRPSSARRSSTTASRPSIPSVTSTAAPAARSPSGSSTAAGSTPTTSSRWTSTTGRTGRATTRP